MTHEERIEALKKRHDKERSELATQLAVLSALPAGLGGLDWFIHASSLYDLSASAHLRLCEYQSLRKSPDVTPAQMRELWNAFDVVDLAVYRDSCVSVRTLSDAHNACMKAETRNPNTSAQLTPIAPLYCRMEGGTRRQFALIWVAVVAGLRVRFEVSPPWDVVKRIGSHVVQYERETTASGHERIVNVCRNTFEGTLETRTLGNSKLETIRYSSGDVKVAGEVLAYWNACNGEPGNVTLPLLLNRLEL